MTEQELKHRKENNMTQEEEIPGRRIAEEYWADKEENKDKCTDCPFNDTSCPGGMYCNEED